ncbi:MAG: DUF3656 domain-containing protein [Nibricoccus sp.]
MRAIPKSANKAAAFTKSIREALKSTLRFGHGDIDFRRVRTGQLLWKTNDPALDKQVRQTFEGEKIRFQRPLHFEVHGRSGGPLTLIAADDEGHSAKLDSQLPLEPAQNQPLTHDQTHRSTRTSRRHAIQTRPRRISSRRRTDHSRQRTQPPPPRSRRRSRATPRFTQTLDAQRPLVPSTLNLQPSTSAVAATAELILVVRTLAQLDAALDLSGRHHTLL